MAMREVLIIKTGSTMPSLAAERGDYEHWIEEGLRVGPVRVCHVAAGEELPDPGDVRAVVVTGSSALVTDREPWSLRTGAWMEEALALELPMLAICYGHQLLADALDGRVDANARGREIGMVPVRLTEHGARDPLFEGMPETLLMSSSHRQAVAELPSGALVLATGHAERYQSYRLGERTWAVQFHPEWDADVMRAYLQARREVLREEGLDPEALLDAVEPVDHGRRLLARFGELI